jgi:hypothetical protein
LLDLTFPSDRNVQVTAIYVIGFLFDIIWEVLYSYLVDPNYIWWSLLVNALIFIAIRWACAYLIVQFAQREANCIESAGGKVEKELLEIVGVQDPLEIWKMTWYLVIQSFFLFAFMLFRYLSNVTYISTEILSLGIAGLALLGGMFLYLWVKAAYGHLDAKIPRLYK